MKKDTYIDICMEIIDDRVSDLKIIQDIEYAKHNEPEFDINWAPSNIYYPFIIYAITEKRKNLVEYLLMDHELNINLVYNNLFTV